MRVGRTKTALIGVLALSALFWGAAPAAAAGPSIVVVGHGWGHGRGLGQWGAYGYAVDQGWRSERILDHYYGGTTAGTIPSGSRISVRLMSPTDATTSWVTSSKDFTVGGKLIAGGSAARLVWNGTRWLVHTSYQGCAHPDNFGPVGVASSEIKLVPKTGTTSADTIVVCSRNRGYRGDLKVVVSGSAKTFVNTLPVEEYLRGVVPLEAVPSWGDARGGLGMEALEAQAVAARSYAWSENRYSYARTCDTTSCQVYGGATYAGAPVTDPRTDTAITRTANKVRKSSSGAVVRTEFSASSGGWTAGGAFPAVEDRGDSRSPRHTWTARLDGAALAAKYGVGTFKRIYVVSQNGLGAGGGRVANVRVEGTTGLTKTVSGAQFRSDWGLNSDWFFFVDQPIRQVTSLAFRKVPYSGAIYRQFGYSPKGWQDHAHMTWTEYVASGKPTPSTMPVDYVKYSWSSTIYAVTWWPQEPYPEWDLITTEEWTRAGKPTPRTVASVYGTLYYKYGSNPAIYAEAPDGVVHHLTWAEYRAAGYPEPEVR